MEIIEVNESVSAELCWRRTVNLKELIKSRAVI